MHKESILSCFGAGLNLACVIDIGSDKLSVCCIEEGQIIKNTHYRKNFGSRDLDYIYKIQCQRNNLISFISEQASQLDHPVEMDQFTKIKELGMNLNKTEDNSNIQFKCLAIQMDKETQFRVRLDNSLYITPHSFFHEKIFNLFNRKQVNKRNDTFKFETKGFSEYKEHTDYIQYIFNS